MNFSAEDALWQASNVDKKMAPTFFLECLEPLNFHCLCVSV